MALVESLPAVLGSTPPYFELEDCCGSMVSIQDIECVRGLLVTFICNHCPYVIAKIERIVETMESLRRIGFGSVAIMPNDFTKFPDDSPENMKKFKEKYKLPCRYLVDKTQEVAEAYSVQCTPEFYLYKRSERTGFLNLAYHGRLDSGGKENNPDDVPELYNAATSADVTGIQHPSIGCSVKWIRS